MRRRDIDQYLTGKLKYAKSECRHTHFLPHLEGRDVPLPSIIALTRGSGDVANNVIGDIAHNLGLREMDFRISVRCEIGAACVYICQAGMCIERSSRQLVADPNVYRENVMAIKISISRLFRASEKLMRPANEWNKKELAALAALVSRLERAYLTAEFQPALDDLKAVVRKFHLGARHAH